MNNYKDNFEITLDKPYSVWVGYAVNGYVDNEHAYVLIYYKLPMLLLTRFQADLSLIEDSSLVASVS